MAFVRDYLNSQFGDDELQEVGINGFTLLARTRERIARTAEIPTTYLEDGSHVNDHVIRNPLVLSIEGNVSNIHARPSPVLEAIRRGQAEVGNITQYLPGRTQAQVGKVSALINDFTAAVDRVDAVIGSAQQAARFVGLLDGESGKSNPERFLDNMEAAYMNGALIRIDMPFRTYNLMCITRLEITRDNQQSALSFVLEAQQFRFAETQFVQVDAAPNPSAGLGGASEGVTDKGAQAGEEMPESLFFSTLRRLGIGG